MVNGPHDRTGHVGALDYGLNKVEHIIDMLNRNVSMSFEVAFRSGKLEDKYTYPGMYRVGPSCRSQALMCSTT